MHAKNIIRPVLVTAAILLVLVVTRFAAAWDLNDFVVMGALLFIVSVTFELIASKAQKTRNRVILGAVLLFVFLVIWADLAVGIFNIPGFSGS